MNFKEILIWLGIFVIGSLIVNFILSPDSSEIIKDKISDVSTKTYESKIETIRLIPSEMEEYGYYKDMWKSCAGVEVTGESQGISDFKKIVCREACGKRDMEYSSDDCEKDLFICYCY